MTDLTEKVNRGASLLDERWHEFGEGNWYDLIDLDTLDSGEVDRCVLAQLFGHYYKGLKTLNKNDNDEDRFYYGFSLDYSIDFEPLTNEWKKVILARRECNSDEGKIMNKHKFDIDEIVVHSGILKRVYCISKNLNNNDIHYSIIDKNGGLFTTYEENIISVDEHIQKLADEIRKTAESFPN